MSTEMQHAIIDALLELCFGVRQTRTASVAIYPIPEEQAEIHQPEPAKSRTESHRMPVAQPQAT